MTGSQEIATLGAGCFWCTEAIFAELKGVLEVEPGYSGGTVPNPTYEQVCSNTTGHAEVAQIIFDKSVVSYRKLLEIYFTVHDPTTLNRQGEDVGTQYRSVIFYHSKDQERIAKEVVEHLEREHIFKSPIVTAIEPFKAFYPAEDYHKKYFKNHPNQPYCRVVIAPKLQKFRQKFRADYLTA